MAFVILSFRSAFGTNDPEWMFADSVNKSYTNLICYDTARYDTFGAGCSYKRMFPTNPGDTGSLDGSPYINFDYQFNCCDSVKYTHPYDLNDTVYRGGPRPGYAGFKTAWDGGVTGFALARYKYLILAHKGPNLSHRVTIRFWFNSGVCGATSYNELIGTFSASDTWRVDTIPIPENIQNKPDIARNWSKYYEMAVLINNLEPNDTTSGPPGCLKIDNIRLAVCNPIDSSQQSQKVNEGEPVTFWVVTWRADSTDVLTYQWKKDGADIAGADDSVYTLASAKSADAGTYTVVVTVSSTNLSYTSQGATLTVDTKEEGCGCGSGTGAALIPPLIFKAMAHRKRKKKSVRV